MHAANCSFFHYIFAKESNFLDFAISQNSWVRLQRIQHVSVSEESALSPPNSWFAAFPCYSPETQPLRLPWSWGQAFSPWLCCGCLSSVSSPGASGLVRLWVCYDVYLNNHGPELWKSKMLSELLLLGLLQKDEKRDAISLAKCGLPWVDCQRWWGKHHVEEILSTWTV